MAYNRPISDQFYVVLTGLLIEKMNLDNPNHQILNPHRDQPWTPGQDLGLAGSLHHLRRRKSLTLIVSMSFFLEVHSK